MDPREALAVLPAAALPTTLLQVLILILPSRRAATLLATLLATLTALTALTALPTLTALLLAVALSGITRVRASHSTSNAKGPYRLWQLFCQCRGGGSGSHPSRG
jgi:hypothetical protein